MPSKHCKIKISRQKTRNHYLGRLSGMPEAETVTPKTEVIGSGLAEVSTHLFGIHFVDADSQLSQAPDPPSAFFGSDAGQADSGASSSEKIFSRTRRRACIDLIPREIMA